MTDDIDRRFSFHTPIAAVMELVNEIQRHPDDPAARFATETAVSLIQPYAPHVAEELWGVLGDGQAVGAAVAGGRSRASRRGRGRDRRAGERQGARPAARVAATTADDELLALALASERVQAHVDGKELRKTIVVPGKLVSLVV